MPVFNAQTDAVMESECVANNNTNCILHSSWEKPQ